MEITQINYEHSAVQFQSKSPEKTTLLAYSQENLSVSYTSKDGDTVQLDFERQRALIATGSVSDTSQKPAHLLSPEEGERFREGLKSDLKAYADELITKYLLRNEEESETADEVAQLEAKMPEYWNAENTSQRIVDFAASFLSGFEGENTEFFQRIRAAVEDGFAQARDILGDLPSAVNGLVDKTFDLTMEKLDALERGLATPDGEVSPEEMSLVA